MIGPLITLIIYLIIVGVIYWAVTTILGVIPAPIAQVIRVLMIVILVLIVVYALLGLVGAAPIHLGRF